MSPSSVDRASEGGSIILMLCSLSLALVLALFIWCVRCWLRCALIGHTARCASEQRSTNQSEHTSAREHSKIQKIMELCGTKAEPPFSINRCNPST
uniref:Uncharacterized protein n=1 Tax=Anopheles darlingi TaxID=43151 RepID=A0A2M4DPK9_ANODA